MEELNKPWLSIDESLRYLGIKSATSLSTLATQYSIRRSKLRSFVWYNRPDMDRVREENAVVWDGKES